MKKLSNTKEVTVIATSHTGYGQREKISKHEITVTVRWSEVDWEEVLMETVEAGVENYATTHNIYISEYEYKAGSHESFFEWVDKWCEALGIE